MRKNNIENLLWTVLYFTPSECLQTKINWKRNTGLVASDTQKLLTAGNEDSIAVTVPIRTEKRSSLCSEEKVTPLESLEASKLMLQVLILAVIEPTLKCSLSLNCNYWLENKERLSFQGKNVNIQTVVIEIKNFNHM